MQQLTTVYLEDKMKVKLRLDVMQNISKNSAVNQMGFHVWNNLGNRVRNNIMMNMRDNSPLYSTQTKSIVKSQIINQCKS